MGDWKQHKQLMKTTFRGVWANLPAHKRCAERKRGVSVLVSGSNNNYGQSRTVLANARTLLERGERIYVCLEFGRGCFYCCLSCFEFNK